MKEAPNMNAFKSNSLKLSPKIVLLVPCLVLFAACGSKVVKNASLEPIDMPAGEASYSNPTPEPEMTAPAAAATTKKSFKKSKKSRKHHKVAKHAVKKKHDLKAAAPVATAQVQSNDELPPSIGDGTVASAPIAMPPMAPPVPFETGLENNQQPNWLLIGGVVAGLVALTGVGLRMRKQGKGKRRLVYNA
jgi:hypothetical protein